MKIGILQTGIVPDNLAEDHGQFPDMFARFLDGNGFEFETFSVVEGKFPSTIRDCDGWLITGSKHAAYEDHPWIPPLEDFIREAYGEGVPIVGVCFGHQIMAQALGGTVEKFGGVWGVGNREYTHPDGTTSTLLAMHQDQVIEVPPEAKVTATSDYCKNAGFAYKGKAISIQPHPEFNASYMEDLIRERAGTVVPTDQAEPAIQSLDQETDTPKYAQQIAEFFLENAPA